MNKKEVPGWIIESRKKMISSGITQKELAREIDLSYQYVRNIFSGRMQSVPAKRKICDYLDIEIEEEPSNGQHRV